jgi:hypothetical protein
VIDAQKKNKAKQENKKGKAISTSGKMKNIYKKINVITIYYLSPLGKYLHGPRNVK